MMKHRICLAPMLDYTDKHFRYLLRLMTQHTILYSEMQTTQAILKGKNPERFLAFNTAEHPVALQLGGSDPQALTACARIGADYGYDEINLNVGCPSARVKAGRFGACLMAEPQLVADCVASMQAAVAVPITVKHRIGIDDLDSHELLVKFIETVVAAGCQTFIIHARKAWLNGLNPKQNRTIPPLHYASVYRIKKDFPDLDIVINGGIETFADIDAHLEKVDGVMLGRAATANPYLFAEIDQRYFNSTKAIVSREEVVSGYEAYCATQTPCNQLFKGLMGLYQGQPGAKAWRNQVAAKAQR